MAKDYVRDNPLFIGKTNPTTTTTTTTSLRWFTTFCYSSCYVAVFDGSSEKKVVSIKINRGSTAVKVLCYKSEGRWFNPSWCHWNFHWHKKNPSDRTMALGSTQPLTEMSTRSISWGLRRPVRKADNLTTILCRCHEIWEPYLPGTLWATPGL